MQNTNLTARLQRVDPEDLIHAFDLVHRPGQHVAFTLEHALSLLLQPRPAMSEASRGRLSAAACAAFACAFRGTWAGLSREEVGDALNAVLRRINAPTGVLASGIPEIKLAIYGFRAAMLREDIARRDNSLTIGATRTA